MQGMGIYDMMHKEKLRDNYGNSGERAHVDGKEESDRDACGRHGDDACGGRTLYRAAQRYRKGGAEHGANFLTPCTRSKNKQEVIFPQTVGPCRRFFICTPSFLY